jgi:hypothetical protein
MNRLTMNFALRGRQSILNRWLQRLFWLLLAIVAFLAGWSLWLFTQKQQVQDLSPLATQAALESELQSLMDQLTPWQRDALPPAWKARSLLREERQLDLLALMQILTTCLPKETRLLSISGELDRPLRLNRFTLQLESASKASQIALLENLLRHLPRETDIWLLAETYKQAGLVFQLQINQPLLEQKP